MPAGSTYTPIATTTLGSAAASYTFSSIPSTYTDLVVVIWSSTGSADNADSFRFNSDSGTNYSHTYLFGNGTTASSGRGTSTNGMQVLGGGLTNGMMSVSHIMNYANSTTYKTVLSRYEVSAGGNRTVAAAVGLWRNTAAITSVTITTTTANTYPVGSTFTLYGIASA
jgi:hypothetical protein